VATLRQWEQRTRRPSGAALALLHIIAYHPAVATRAVIRARAAER
jgi:DNA-binding transcriptional regulator YiaG